MIGGGGISGIAWALGVLVGLKPACPPSWQCIVGTSAGATVGAQLATGQLLDAFEAQFRTSAERAVDVDMTAYLDHISRLVDGTEHATAARARIGLFAIESSTVAPQARRAIVASRLGSCTWPEDDRLLLTTVDADTGELVILRANSGVELIDAVTASCAVPGIWPVVRAGGRRLMDGGMRSLCNADLGPPGGARLVLVPSSLNDRARRRLARELSSFDARVIEMDSPSLRAVGTNPFDPDRRAAAAEEGRRQGVAARREVAALV